MPHDPHLQTYMREIRRTPLLTPEQERELSRRLIRDNDPAARDAMLLANLRFVVKIARRYTRRGLDLQDLIAEGNFALLRAVEGFNPEMNDRFATYASFWIKQAIERALLKYERPFPVTCYTNKKIGKWKLAVVDVAGQLGWAPTLEELPDHLAIAKLAPIWSAPRPRRCGGPYVSKVQLPVGCILDKIAHFSGFRLTTLK